MLRARVGPGWRGATASSGREVEGRKGRTGNDGVHGLARPAGGGSLEGRGKAGGSVTSRRTAEGEVGSDCKSTSVTRVIREKKVMHACKNLPHTDRQAEKTTWRK